MRLADLGAARTDQRRAEAGGRSRYPSYLGVPAWPNTLGETIRSEGELQASPAWVARSVKLPELFGLRPEPRMERPAVGTWPVQRAHTHLQKHPHRWKSPLKPHTSRCFSMTFIFGKVLLYCCSGLYALTLSHLRAATLVVFFTLLPLIVSDVSFVWNCHVCWLQSTTKCETILTLPAIRGIHHFLMQHAQFALLLVIGKGLGSTTLGCYKSK